MLALQIIADSFCPTLATSKACLFVLVSICSCQSYSTASSSLTVLVTSCCRGGSHLWDCYEHLPILGPTEQTFKIWVTKLINWWAVYHSSISWHTEETLTCKIELFGCQFKTSRNLTKIDKSMLVQRQSSLLLHCFVLKLIASYINFISVTYVNLTWSPKQHY